MKPIVTVIGEKAAVFAPTSVRDGSGLGRQPSVIGQPTPSVQPAVTVIGSKPSSIEPTRVAAGPAPVFQPTVLPTAVSGASESSVSPIPRPGPTIASLPADAVPEPIKTAKKDWKPTSLPGVFVDIAPVDLSDLVSRFPHEQRQVLDRVRSLLPRSALSARSAFWLAFGVADQEALSSSIKLRLSYAERPTLRSVTQHLSRLHELLDDVVESLGGGLLRKSAHRVWQAAEPEIHQLESLLRAGAGELARFTDELSQLKAASIGIEAQLAASGCALEFALDRVQQDVAGVVLSRLTSITGSQALLKDHTNCIELHVGQIHQTASLILDGVLVKLPSLYGLLASLPAKPSETQRFLATEKLSELTQLLPR